MSANNWTTCPRCAKQRLAEHDALGKKIKASYGVVDRDKYKAMLEQYDRPPHVTSTLREDHEIWMEPDGLFLVSYWCSCSACGFEWQYRYEEKVPT